MTNLTLSRAKLDQIDVSGLAISRTPATPLRTDTQKAGAVTGLTSGNADFDQLMDKLHVAFGALTRTDEDQSHVAARAAEDLSTSYASMTGRIQPLADDAANQLAASLQHGLSTVSASISDQTGLSMLRSL